ncbi:hypothetical protein [Rhodopirellula sp. MGV]|uniref:hypothetical protein n=1 Tax=Rhodopirellula sp. MGV TaxID=2023130 RepID=UPI000B9700B0|nr:hypothetical protein [Rhodopirellula sp. MGV]OYP28365.1 hypothetical protein CGZ80_26480 [Rhodopirellula sp. MGV]PNY38759.1 hypothetical protein C2E31_02310 [Rhodopirellula baltica]
MKKGWIRAAAFTILAGLSGSLATADEPAVKTAGQTEAPNSGPFASGNVIQVGEGETIALRMLRQVSHEIPRELIRFEIYIVDVNDETRESIYEQINHENIQTEITTIEAQNKAPAAAASDSTAASSRRTVSGSIISTASLTPEQFQSAMAFVRDNPQSGIVSTPKIIVAPGQTGAIEQMVQRPFVSKLREVALDNQVSFESGIEVLNEGIHLAVEGEWIDQELLIRTKLQQSQVTDVQEYSLYGIGDKKLTLQVPTHETRLAATSQKLASGNVLMLDPFIRKTSEQTETKVSPELSAVPYAKKMFGKQVTESVTTSTLVFIAGEKVTPKENVGLPNGQPAK